MVLKAHAFRQVLIIDDDPSSLFLARMTLEDMQIAGKINPVQSAGEGLKYLRTNCISGPADEENCPDLIMLDINTPGMDGFDFLEQLELPGRQQVMRRVVVVVTSSANPRDQDVMQSCGVRGVVVKPLTEEKLMHLIAGQTTA